jgi:hypothetical protein
MLNVGLRRSDQQEQRHAFKHPGDVRTPGKISSPESPKLALLVAAYLAATHQLLLMIAPAGHGCLRNWVPGSAWRTTPRSVRRRAGR